MNTAGVIPPIFASSVLLFPATIASFIKHPITRSISDALTPGRVGYELLFVAFIIFFCYFYTAVTFNPVDVADNMKKYGGFVPGIRPGKKTAEYIDKILTRITLGGAIYVSVICRPSQHPHRPLQRPLLFRRDRAPDRGGGSRWTRSSRSSRT